MLVGSTSVRSFAKGPKENSTRRRPTPRPGAVLPHANVLPASRVVVPPLAAAVATVGPALLYPSNRPTSPITSRTQWRSKQAEFVQPHRWRPASPCAQLFRSFATEATKAEETPQATQATQAPQASSTEQSVAEKEKSNRNNIEVQRPKRFRRRHRRPLRASDWNYWRNDLMSPWNRGRSWVDLSDWDEDLTPGDLLDLGLISRGLGVDVDDLADWDRDISNFSDLGRSPRKWRPSVDTVWTDDKYLVRLDLPGVRKEDLRVEAEADELVVSGRRSEGEDEEEEWGTWPRRGRDFGKFRERISLPNSIDPKQIDAKFSNGVLKIAIPTSSATTIPIRVD